ncbi:MAG: hypothetical protein GYA61_01950 [Spirochaetales bacterium]|nr:hypothetical protein [Spirochaetales bacterium]
MFYLLGWFSEDNLLKLLTEKKDSNLIIFHINQDDFIREIKITSDNIIFIKTSNIILNGKFLDFGFLVYETKLKLVNCFFNSNSDLILANLKNSRTEIKNGFIISNIIKNDEGNDLIFFLSTIFGVKCKIIGIDFEKFQNNCVYYNGNFYNHYFFLFSYDSEINFKYIDEFWEDYLGPYLITDAFDGGFKNISWQNPVQFFLNKIPSLSYQHIENSIKYFPIKIISLKEDYSIIKLKMDFGKSIDLFYNDISVFSYQYAFIEKCNIHILFNKIRSIKKEGKFNLFILSGDLPFIINEYLKNNFKLTKLLSFKSFTGITSNLIIIPTKSIPKLTTNCIFGI